MIMIKIMLMNMHMIMTLGPQPPSLSLRPSASSFQAPGFSVRVSGVRLPVYHYDHDNGNAYDYVIISSA